MPFSVGFGGQKRNGKDAASDHLFALLNKNGEFTQWKRGSLGHAVKQIFADHFGVTLEFIEEWKTKDEIPEGFNGPIRTGLTKIGDAWRDTKADIWIRKLFDGNRDNMVISDVRYINEAEYIRKNGGMNVLVWRPGFENDKPSRSEQELMPFVRRLMKEPSGLIDHDKYPDIPFDCWLRNNGTKEEWLNKVEDIVLPQVLKRL